LNDQQVSELIDRLSLRIGNNSIHRYLPDEHYWPERSFKKSNSFFETSASEWKLDRPRPLRFLSTPEMIEVTAPVPDYPPMLFRYKGKLHQIKKADGPERIEQEWWIRKVSIGIIMLLKMKKVAVTGSFVQDIMMQKKNHAGLFMVFLLNRINYFKF
jgi:nucleotidyltransferase/DNA polymerase involved in DNA repair